MSVNSKPEASTAQKYKVPAVVGAIKVMDELAQQGDAGATQARLVEATGLSKSTMHNLLSTLEAHDYVRRDADTRMYRLGPALIPLGAEAGRQVKLVRSTIVRIAPLPVEHHLSFAVAQLTGRDQCRIIERFYPVDNVHVGISVGSSYGPLDGALGKILLAHMEPARAKRLIKGRKLPAHTDASITSPGTLTDEIRQTREQGWSISRGEFNQNNAVAAGIRGQNGKLALILLALGFPGDLGDDRMTEIGEILTGVATEVMAEAGVDPALVTDG